MGFNFDVEAEAKKAKSARANSANSANFGSEALPISRISNISKPEDSDYTPDDLAKMDDLLRQLASIEGWPEAELNRLLDERRRMAPGRVRNALEQIRAAVVKALEPWPSPPPGPYRHRRLCVLTVIEGGKPEDADQAKSQIRNREAA